MKDDARYNLAAYFDTFPFAPEWESSSILEKIAHKYYDYRAELMVRKNEGLPKTYNRFHDPGETSPDIHKMRLLHAAMDRAVLDAYGWDAKDEDLVCEFILTALAKTTSFEAANNDIKNRLADMLKKTFPRDLSWRNSVHPILVGIGFQRAGLFKETLPFYEVVFKSTLLSAKTRELAETRWAWTKINQSNFELENGANAKAQKHKEEATQVAVKLGFQSPSDIGELLPNVLPVVNAPGASIHPETKTPTIAQPESRVSPDEVSEDYSLSMTLGDLRVSVNKQGSRINIENTSTFETETIKVIEHKIRFEYCQLELDSSKSVSI